MVESITLQVPIGATVPIVTAEKLPDVSVVYRGSNITLLADELQASTLQQEWFQDLGQPKDVIKTSDITFFDYETASIFIHAAGKRAVAADSSSQLVATSRIAVMMDRIVRELKFSKVSALAFSFNYEAVFKEQASKFLADKYLRSSAISSLGKDVRPAGVRLVSLEDDHVVRVTLDSVAKNPFAISLLLNYHHDTPSKAVYSDIINRFGQYTAEAPSWAEKIVNVA